MALLRSFVASPLPTADAPSPPKDTRAARRGVWRLRARERYGCDIPAGGAEMSDMESDRLPQHDPPRSRLIQPEVDARDDSLVVEGDDRDHVLPPTELDPYTPDFTPPQRARNAMWVA